MKIKRNLGISLAFLIFYCFKNKTNPILINLCNGFFIIGLIFLCLACGVHIRNSGLFKSFHYFKYRKTKNFVKEEREKKNDISPFPDELRDFAAYIDDKYTNVWTAKQYYIIAIPCLTICVLLVFLSSMV